MTTSPYLEPKQTLTYSGSEYPAQTSAFTAILFLRFFLPVPSGAASGFITHKDVNSIEFNGIA